MGKFLLILLILAGAIWGGIILSRNGRPLSGIKSGLIMQITSPNFANNGTIPVKYTCSGLNINPTLSFSTVPADTRSLVLIMEDPDAPNGTFNHWLVYNMPSSTRQIAENSIPSGTVLRNGAGEKSYLGPCPPSGEHRYSFTLYALDISIESGTVGTKNDLLQAMAGHTLEQAKLVGRFAKAE